MKKVFNWLGLLLNTLYIVFMIIVKVFGDRMQLVGNIELRNILYAISVIMLISFFALYPAIWHKTLGVLLPLKTEHVILIDKSVETKYVTMSGNQSVHSATKFFLTFQFNDGTRKTFCVNTSMYGSDIFFNILQIEQGTLQYKEQGKHLYFVSFTPDSTGKTISKNRKSEYI